MSFALEILLRERKRVEQAMGCTEDRIREAEHELTLHHQTRKEYAAKLQDIGRMIDLANAAIGITPAKVTSGSISSSMIGVMVIDASAIVGDNGSV